MSALAAYGYALAGVFIGMLVLSLFQINPSTTEEELREANHRLRCENADLRERLERA